LGWLDCRVEDRLDTGDRTVYLAAVVAARLENHAAPLTVRRMLELAPADKRKELKEQIARDCAVDAPAIEGWRRAHHVRLGPEA
jgi:flavin reductase (DIM6/NTAB) family NADH-FMN oxidoreductase RutF